MTHYLSSMRRGVGCGIMFGLARKRPLETLVVLALNAPFLEPSWNMRHQILNKTPYRRQHSPRGWVNQVQNILRPRPFRQHSLNEPLFQRCGYHLFWQQCDANAVYRSLKSRAQITCDKPRLQLDMLPAVIMIR